MLRQNCLKLQKAAYATREREMREENWNRSCKHEAKLVCNGPQRSTAVEIKKSPCEYFEPVAAPATMKAMNPVARLDGSVQRLRTALTIAAEDKQETRFGCCGPSDHSVRSWFNYLGSGLWFQNWLFDSKILWGCSMLSPELWIDCFCVHLLHIDRLANTTSLKDCDSLPIVRYNMFNHDM